MRITIDVPDRVGPMAVVEHRTVRQQAEYLITRALRELDEQERREQVSKRQTEPTR